VSAAKAYVCVRVVNMKGVDLNTYVFDFDLTFSVLLMHPDGTIYHRYGTRDWTGASDRLSIESLTRLLRDAVADHEAYAKNPRPRETMQRRTLEDIPPFAERLKGKDKPDCYHCHFVHEFEREHAQRERRWSPDDRWLWPLPEQIGLKLDAADAPLVKEAVKDSAAAKAGLKAGDRLTTFGGQRVRTEADVQWILQTMPVAGGEVAVEAERAGQRVSATVKLGKGWKVQSALDYSWRPAMWLLRPDPGFGGSDLTADQKKALGLKEDAFAIRVGYLIDWGDRAETGRNARKAGVQKEDVLIAVDGVRDFENHAHFQTWFRFTRRAGEKVELLFLRDGKQVTVKMEVLP
jgi:predicted metalloprotease with PDZ domain